jgi:hypothetical protein
LPSFVSVPKLLQRVVRESTSVCGFWGLGRDGHLGKEDDKQIKTKTTPSLDGTCSEQMKCFSRIQTQ